MAEYRSTTDPFACPKCGSNNLCPEDSGFADFASTVYEYIYTCRTCLAEVSAIYDVVFAEIVATDPDDDDESEM